MDKVSNKGTVTPPDEGKPGGSSEGSFQPNDAKTYVTKQIDKNTAATDGKVEWSSLVKMSLMDKDTIPGHHVRHGKEARAHAGQQDPC